MNSFSEGLQREKYIIVIALKNKSNSHGRVERTTLLFGMTALIVLQVLERIAKSDIQLKNLPLGQ